MLKLLSAPALVSALGHTTRWVLIPVIVIAVILAGMFFISDDAFNIGLRSIAASLLFLFIAVTAVWLFSRWLDWLSNVRFKDDVAPTLRQNTIAVSIYYSARWIGLCYLVGTILATVRF